MLEFTKHYKLRTFASFILHFFVVCRYLNTQYVELIGNMLQHSKIGFDDTKNLQND